LLLGDGTKVATMLTPKHLGYSPDIPGYEFDLEKAKSLLAEAGYPDGVELDFVVGTGGQDKELAEAIAGQLSEAGIKANINLVESAVLLGGWQKHDFGDMLLATWTSNTFDADGTLYPLFHSGTVWSNYNNPTMDQLLDQARSLLDRAAREPLYKQALQILHDDLPGVPLWEQFAIFGLSKRLQWKPRPDQELFLVEASLSA
jgi:peptide/nickel transport system substrate-binding protein